MDIAQYNTADVENFGDILYPVALRKFINDCGHQISKHYSFLGGKAPLEAGYVTQPINDLFREIGPKEKIIIGGGDILRMDDDVVAGHYHAFFEKPPVSFARRDYWSPAPKTPLQLFRERALPPLRGAFLLSKENCPRVDRVAYFSAGVPFEFLEDDYPLVRSVFDQAAYIYVRDTLSAKKLKQAGVSSHIATAPDFLVGISEYYRKIDLRSQAENLLHAIDHDPTVPYLSFQISLAGLNDLSVIASALHEFSVRHGLRILLLPLGFCHHDREVLQKFSTMSAGEFKLLGVKSIEDMLAIIAHSAMFAGVSMHGNIVARSYGVPHLFGPLPGVEKILGAMEMLRARPAHLLTRWEDLQGSLDALAEVNPDELVSTSRLAFGESLGAARSMMKSIAD